MVLSGESVKIAYGEYVAVENIDVNVKSEEITSIIGPNGSGKSTVLKALTRLLPYKKGYISLNGQDIKKIDSMKFAREIAVLPQKHDAPPDFKVKDLVGYGRMPYQKWYKSAGEEDEKVIEWAMKTTGVYEFKDKSINGCSGGEGQRVWIATVLAQQPEILFLDEPTTYLDIAYQIDTMKLVKKLNREAGIGIVMVLHDICQALEISDKIIVIKDGKLYDEGKPEEVITSKMMKEVYNIDCDIVKLENREKPIIVYKEIK